MFVTEVTCPWYMSYKHTLRHFIKLKAGTLLRCRLWRKIRVNTNYPSSFEYLFPKWYAEIKHLFEHINKCFSVYQWSSSPMPPYRSARPGTMFPRRFRAFHNKRSRQLSVLCPLYSPKLLVVVEHNSLIQLHAAQTRSTWTDPVIKQLWFGMLWRHCGYVAAERLIDQKYPVSPPALRV